VLLKQAAGTRSFAAPEVLAGKEASQSSDLYSLAKVFSKMTKRHRRVLERCMSADPSSRYADAAALKAALLKKKSIRSLMTAPPQLPNKWCKTSYTQRPQRQLKNL
jgi:serine/threonine protein kinase